jgi:hypothetical protein
VVDAAASPDVDLVVPVAAHVDPVGLAHVGLVAPAAPADVVVDVAATPVVLADADRAVAVTEATAVPTLRMALS